MENASEALKMAGAVLLFVLALSIIIFSFGQARESADTILDYRDRETAYIDTNYYYTQTVNSDGSINTERSVGLETIIPSVTRAYLENYKIVFDGLSEPIYRIKNKNGDLIDKYTLDLETNQNLVYKNAVLANNEQKIKFLKGVFFGKCDNYPQNEMEEDFKKLGIEVNNINPLYKQLTKKLEDGYKIKEYLGIYYQSDEEDVPDINKTKKRVITYKIVK